MTARVAYAEVLSDETGPTIAAFLRRATRWFRRRGVRVERFLTDNGTGYRSHVFRAAAQAQRLVHRRTRPYTPRTNGKASASFAPCCRSGHTGSRFAARPTAPPPPSVGCTNQRLRPSGASLLQPVD